MLLALSAGDIVRCVSYELQGRYDHAVQRCGMHDTQPVDADALHVVIGLTRKECFVEGYEDRNDPRNTVIVVMSASGLMHAYLSGDNPQSMRDWFARI